MEIFSNRINNEKFYSSGFFLEILVEAFEFEKTDTSFYSKTQPTFNNQYLFYLNIY